MALNEAAQSSGAAYVPPVDPRYYPQDRRCDPRHKCIGVAEVNLFDGRYICRGRVYDVSLHGCRLWSRTGVYAPLDGDIEIVLEVEGVRFRVGGVVRSVDAQHGMGVEFLQLSHRCRGYVLDLITELAGLPPGHHLLGAS